MCLIFLTCSLFLPASMSHLVVCSSIDTPLDWFDPWSAFYHFILYIRRFLAKSRIICRFLAKSHVYMQVFGQKSHIHIGFWIKVTYICYCSLKSHVDPPFCLSLMLWEVVGWVMSVAGSSWVLMLSIDYFYVTRDDFFIDFSLKVVLVIYFLFLFCH